MQIEIKVRDGYGKIIERTVTAYKTKSPNLFITPSQEKDSKGKWAITHVPTGYALVHNVDYRKDAIEAANILASLKLENVTPENSEEFFKHHSRTVNKCKKFLRSKGVTIS